MKVSTVASFHILYDMTDMLHSPFWKENGYMASYKFPEFYVGSSRSVIAVLTDSRPFFLS